MNEKTVTRIMMILNPEEEDEEHTSRNEGQVVKTLVEVGGLLIIFLLMQTGHVMIAKIMTLISTFTLIAMAIWHILRENNPRTKNGETTTRKMLYSPSLRELCKLADDGASDHEIKESAYFLSLQHELIRILRDNKKKVKRNLDRFQIGLTAPLR